MHIAPVIFLTVCYYKQTRKTERGYIMEIMQYEDSFGPVKWQEGFEKELAGRSIEEQLRCFALTEYSWMCDIPYAELEKTIRQREYSLGGIHAVYDEWSAVVHNGMVVGVAYNRWDYGRVIGKMPLLPYCGYVYDSSSDNNGSGYKTCDWYKYLVCLPYDHTLW